jgi:hypothetical protein
LLARGDVDAANPKLDEARELFESLLAVRAGDEQATLGLALTLFSRYAMWGLTGAPGGQEGDLQRAADLLRPLAHAPGSSSQTRIAYADVLNYLSHQQPKEAAIATCEEARKVLVDVGALDFTNLSAASVYADTSDSQARHALSLGRLDESERLTHQVYAIAEKVLAQRPGDLRSMRNRALAADLLGQLAMRRHDYAAAAEYAARAELAGQSYVQFNPADLSAWDYWIRGKGQVSDTLFERGRVLESIDVLRASVALEKDPRLPSSLGPQLTWTWAELAGLEARSGQRAAAEKSLREAMRANDELLKVTGDTGQWRQLLPLMPDAWRQRIQLYFGEHREALDGSAATARRMSGLQLPADDENSRRVRANLLRFALGTESMAALQLGRDADAERALRERLTLPPNPFSGDDPQDETSRSQVMLAHAVARQGRGAEAREIVQPVLERYRAEQARGAGGITFQRDLAYALYADAIAQDDDRAGQARREASLAEAANLLASLPAEAQQLWDMRTVADLIAAARRS